MTDRLRTSGCHSGFAGRVDQRSDQVTTVACVMDQVIPPARYHLDVPTAGLAREELPPGAISVEPLLDTLRSLHPDADTTVVRRAHDLAKKSARGPVAAVGRAVPDAHDRRCDDRC